MIAEILNEFTNFKSYPNRNKIVIFFTSTFVFFIVFLWAVYSLLRNDLTSKDNTVPNDGPGDEYNQIVERQIKENEPVERASYKITEFIQTLPYSGSLINLTYSFDTGEFKLTYKTKDFEEAREEYINLLTKNGITEKQIERDLIEVYEEN